MIDLEHVSLRNDTSLLAFCCLPALLRPENIPTAKNQAFLTGFQNIQRSRRTLSRESQSYWVHILDHVSHCTPKFWQTFILEQTKASTRPKWLFSVVTLPILRSRWFRNIVDHKVTG